MRAELKIGIAVGLVIALVAVLYVVFHDGGAKSALPKSTAKSPTHSAVPKGPLPPPETDTLVPSFGAAAPAAEPPTVGLVELAPGEAATQPTAPEATRAEGPLAVSLAPPTPTTRPSDAPVLTPVAPTALPRPTASVTPSAAITPAASITPTASIATPTSYVVKQGDKGFWGIAETVYGPGKGRYWSLIAKANPQADATSLKEGITLTIPPLPGQQPTTALPTAPTSLVSAGEQVYTVQPGDGWWVISRKAYGDGKYWQELRRANPHVESALQVGQKIKIPRLDAVTAPTVPTVSPAATGPAAPTSRTAPDDRPMFD